MIAGFLLVWFWLHIELCCYLNILILIPILSPGIFVECVENLGQGETEVPCPNQMSAPPPWQKLDRDRGLADFRLSRPLSGRHEQIKKKRKKKESRKVKLK